MLKLNSADIRNLVAKCEAEVSETGQRLTDADATYKAAVRAALLNGTSDAPAQAAALAATQAHHRATDRLQTARTLLSEALAAEKEATDAQVRADLRSITAKIGTAANAADKAWGEYLAQLAETRRLEAEARSTVQNRLNRPVEGAAVVHVSLGDAVAHLEAVRAGNASPIRGFTAERAAIGIRRVLTAAGA